jgi:hypothetical protein
MCDVLLPPGVNTTAVKYTTIYHIISYIRSLTTHRAGTAHCTKREAQREVSSAQQQLWTLLQLITLWWALAVSHFRLYGMFPFLWYITRDQGSRPVIGDVTDSNRRTESNRIQVSLSIRFIEDRQATVRTGTVGGQRLMQRHLTTAAFCGLTGTFIQD